MAPRRITYSNNNQYVITLYKGITYSRVFQYTDSNGDPIDLTSKIVSIKFKDVFSSQLELFSNGDPTDLGSTFLITDEEAGTFRLQLTDEETAEATAGSGKWWIEIYTGADVDLLWLDDVDVIAL